ncbi:MAG: FMN-binding protein [Pseudomonadota bacterium]
MTGSRSRFPPSALAWSLLPAGMIALHAPAAEYLTVAQAQRLMFPLATSFAAQPETVTAEWLRRAKARGDENYGRRPPQIREARQGDVRIGWFVIDQVIGKFEKIDYAVALTPDGTVLQVEVLVYRENHGDEVRAREWLQQFEGKNANAPIRLGQDIVNIADSTLSSAHLTDGVRRIARLLAPDPATPR